MLCLVDESVGVSRIGRVCVRASVCVCVCVSVKVTGHL